MEINEILSTLNTVFRDVLDNDTLSITVDTTAGDVEEWDSLNHIQLVVAAEKKFKIRFTTAEINSWKKVGDMCLAIQKKQS